MGNETEARVVQSIAHVGQRAATGGIRKQVRPVGNFTRVRKNGQASELHFPSLTVRCKMKGNRGTLLTDCDPGNICNRCGRHVRKSLVHSIWSDMGQEDITTRVQDPENVST